MKKYIGAVVRKPFQLVIAAEQDHFENQTPMAKKNIPLRNIKKEQNFFLITMKINLQRE